MAAVKHSLFHPPIVRRAIWESLYKLAPRHMLRNPVMFVVLVGSVLTTLALIRDLVIGEAGVGFTVQLALWLWFTVLFANFAEAMAEGRGKAQADALRATRQETRVKRLRDPRDHIDFLSVFATELRAGDHVIVKTGDFIPADGEVVEGVASVDESAITGESAPVIRESGVPWISGPTTTSPNRSASRSCWPASGLPSGTPPFHREVPLSRYSELGT